MKTKKALALLICAVVVGTAAIPLFAQDNPQKGTYDGVLDGKTMILVAENSDSVISRGYYILKRTKAIEEPHTFSLEKNGSSIIFRSDLYTGKLKSREISTDKISGILSLTDRKKRFFFFPQKATLSFDRRQELVIAPSERYRGELFKDIELKKDLVYGRAMGYWTESPYSDDAYIEVLAKGMIKTFKDPSLLDLKLDLYLPLSDKLERRPLVLLIHGGGFYIGSKQSVAEKALADALSKRGYVVASMDYRLGFKPLAKDIEFSAFRAIQDVHAALRFLSKNAEELRIDPTQIYVGGTSAGAVASLGIAFMGNDECPERIKEAQQEGIFGKIESSGNNYTSPFKIKAVVNMWGAVSDLKMIDDTEKIPVLSIHGTADEVVPFEHDYPFQNSLLLNRLLMGKMYGSKVIHDRLKMLGIKNKLVAFEGLGHEPELLNHNTLNQNMDTITSHVVRFLSDITSPEIIVPTKQLELNSLSVLKPYYYEVVGGSVVDIRVTGGVKANSDHADLSVIWLKNTPDKKFTVVAKNQFDAWTEKTFSVKATN